MSPLELIAQDGKRRMTQCANTEGLLRIIQSIPSPKAESFKRWLAKQYFKLEEGAVMIEPDVRKYFPDSDSVNKALRSLIELFPGKKTRRTLREKVL